MVKILVGPLYENTAASVLSLRCVRVYVCVSAFMYVQTCRNAGKMTVMTSQSKPYTFVYVCDVQHMQKMPGSAHNDCLDSFGHLV